MPPQYAPLAATIQPLLATKGTKITKYKQLLTFENYDRFIPRGSAFTSLPPKVISIPVRESLSHHS